MASLKINKMKLFSREKVCHVVKLRFKLKAEEIRMGSGVKWAADAQICSLIILQKATECAIPWKENLEQIYKMS